MSTNNPDNPGNRRGLAGPSAPHRHHGFQKGQPSANPGGRSKGEIAVRRLQHELIAQETDGGREIIKFVLEMFRGQVTDCMDSKSRRWAVDFLADRLWGRAPVTVTLQTPKMITAQDLKTMSLAELEQELARHAAGTALPEPAPEDPGVIDVPSGDIH